MNTFDWSGFSLFFIMGSLGSFMGVMCFWACVQILAQKGMEP